MCSVAFVIVLLLLGLVLLYASTVCNLSCGGKESYGDFNEYCRWDSRRFCILPNGDGGKCVMNGLCVPSMLMTDGPENIKQPLPDTQGQSPVAPTWKWKGETGIPLEDMRNDYSDASVMDYVDLLADSDSR